MTRKTYLKGLYENQLSIDEKFDRACERKSKASSKEERAYYDGLATGLEKGSKHVEACINNYLSDVT